jgi:hypothetical protein
MTRRKRTAVVAVLAAAGTATITAFATGAASFGGGHGKLSPELGSPMSLDNTSFLSRDTFGVVEDAGDTLHGQRNALDSGYALDVDLNYANPANQPLRWLAEGRDASAAIDSAFNGFGKNDGDNELTSTSPTAIRPCRACSGRRRRSCGTTAGAGSTPSSTATTRCTRSSPRAEGKRPHTRRQGRRGCADRPEARTPQRASGDLHGSSGWGQFVTRRSPPVHPRGSLPRAHSECDACSYVVSTVRAPRSHHLERRRAVTVGAGRPLWERGVRRAVRDRPRPSA